MAQTAGEAASAHSKAETPRGPSARPKQPEPVQSSANPAASETEGNERDSDVLALGGAPAVEAPESPAVERPALAEGLRVVAFAGGVPLPPDFDAKVAQLTEHSAHVAEAAAQIGQELEELPNTNAGVGAALRLDGATIECDAVVMDARGRKGFAGGLRSNASPLMVAAALYRAGGVTMRGRAVDELAISLGAAQTDLLTEAASAAYVADLREHVGKSAASGRGGLESFYVNPENLRAALASAPGATRKDSERLPVFVIVASSEGIGVAGSSGGHPLSYPGTPTLLDAPHEALAIGEDTVVAVLGPADKCPLGAQKALQQVQNSGSSLLVAQELKRVCDGVPYVIFSGKTLRTNIPREVLYLRGEGLEENERAQQSAGAPSTSLARQGSPTPKSSFAAPGSPASKSSSAAPGSPASRDELPPRGAPAASTTSAVPSSSVAPKTERAAVKPEVSK